MWGLRHACALAHLHVCLHVCACCKLSSDRVKSSRRMLKGQASEATVHKTPPPRARADPHDSSQKACVQEGPTKHKRMELAITINGVVSSAHAERGSAHMLRQTLSRWQTDLGVDGMSNGLTLDALSSMTELPTMLHEVLCQGRHILSLEDVPHSAGSTIPMIAAPLPFSLSSSNSFTRAAGQAHTDTANCVQVH